MTSQRKLRAHRANARSGTGRKPPRGVRKRGKSREPHRRPNTGRMSVTRLHFYVVPNESVTLLQVHIGGPLEASMMIVNRSLNRRGNDTGS